MCTHEKQDLFSNDLDNAGFKHESVMGIWSIFICLTVKLERNDVECVSRRCLGHNLTYVQDLS